MKKSSITIPSKDGNNLLNVIIWETEEKPKGILQLVHGMAEYIERYNDFAAYLTRYGYNVIGHDHLGHGKTAKCKEDLGFFADKNGDEIIIEDMYSVTKYAKERWNDIPNYILGHSMGSFCVRQYLTEHSYDVYGAIIMGTGWIPAPVANMGKFLADCECKKHGNRYKSRTLVKISIGNNNKPFEPARTPVDWLSRDFNNVDKYVADSLCGFDFTAGAYRDFFAILQKIARNKNLLGIRKHLPILVISGEEDPVGGKEACKKFVSQCLVNGLGNTILKLLPYDRHEILNEIDKDIVYIYLKNWLNDRVYEAEAYKEANILNDYEN